MLKLSRHFIDNWKERIGGSPDVEEVKAIIRESLLIQRCNKYQRFDGRESHTLAIYWHPARSIVIKVDETKDKAVTVLSPKNRGGLTVKLWELMDLDDEWRRRYEEGGKES